MTESDNAETVDVQPLRPRSATAARPASQSKMRPLSAISAPSRLSDNNQNFMFPLDYASDDDIDSDSNGFGQRETVSQILRHLLVDDDLQNLEAILEQLDLSHAGLRKLPIDIRNFSVLVSINLSHNRIRQVESDMYVSALFVCFSIAIKLTLDNSIVRYLPQLKCLDISYNDIRDAAVVQKLGHLKALEELFVQGNPFPVADNRPALLQKLLFCDLNCPSLRIEEEPQTIVIQSGSGQPRDSPASAQNQNVITPRNQQESVTSRTSTPLDRRNDAGSSFRSPLFVQATSRQATSQRNTPARQGDSPVMPPFSSRPQTPSSAMSTRSLQRQSSSSRMSTLDGRDDARSSEPRFRRPTSAVPQGSHSLTTLANSKHESIESLRKRSTPVQRKLLAKTNSQPLLRPNTTAVVQYKVTDWSQVSAGLDMSQKTVQKDLRDKERQRLMIRHKLNKEILAKGIPPPNQNLRLVTKEDIEARSRYFNHTFAPAEMAPFKESLSRLNVKFRSKTFNDRIKPCPVPRDFDSPFPMLRKVNGHDITVQEYLAAENEEIFDICSNKALLTGSGSCGNDNQGETVVEGENKQFLAQSAQFFAKMDTFARRVSAGSQLDLSVTEEELQQAATPVPSISQLPIANEIEKEDDESTPQSPSTASKQVIRRSNVEVEVTTLANTRKSFAHDPLVTSIIDKASKRDEFVTFDDYRTMKNQNKWNELQEQLNRPLNLDFTNVLRWDHMTSKRNTDKLLGVTRNKTKDFRPLKERFMGMSSGDIDSYIMRTKLNDSQVCRQEACVRFLADISSFPIPIEINDAAQAVKWSEFDPDKVMKWIREDFDAQTRKMSRAEVYDEEAAFERAHPNDEVSKLVNTMRRYAQSFKGRSIVDDIDNIGEALEMRAKEGGKRPTSSLSTRASMDRPLSISGNRAVKLQSPIKSRTPQRPERSKLSSSVGAEVTIAPTSPSLSASKAQRQQKRARMEGTQVEIDGVRLSYSSLFV